MAGSTKADKKQNNQQLYEQLIKLTKENQYLHVKIEALYQQNEQLFRQKEKYKSKYKHAKEINRKKQTLKTQQILKTQEEEGWQSCRQGSETKLDKCQLTCDQHKSKQNLQSIEQNINKVNDAVVDISLKLERILVNMENQQYPHPFLIQKITGMGQMLNSIAYRIKDNEENSKLKMGKKSPGNSGQKVPERDTVRNVSNIGRFVESKSQQSMAFKQNQNPEGTTHENSQNWKLLKEIGKELKDWRFSLSDEQY